MQQAKQWVTVVVGFGIGFILTGIATILIQSVLILAVGRVVEPVVIPLGVVIIIAGGLLGAFRGARHGSQKN